MKRNELISTVEIKTDDKIYLYPKKRGRSQCLIELDKMGYIFWQQLKNGQDMDIAVENICNQFAISDMETKKCVKRDMEEFSDTLKEAGMYIGSRHGQVQDGIRSDVSEISFSEKFSEMQKYYTSNRKLFKFFIELTYSCNLRCRHCYRGEEVKDINSGKDFLSSEVVCRLLDQIEEMGGVEVIFTGGEPFLHPDIFGILEHASKKNLIITVLSNGNYLTDRKQVEKLKEYDIFDIRISLYGLQKCHDAMTMVAGSFEKSLTALKNIHEILDIGTGAVVVTKENYHECEQLISLLKEEGINVAVNSSITPTAKGNIEPLGFRISVKEYEELVEKFHLPLTGTTCTAGISRFRINPKGDVNPCELIPGYRFGNVYINSLEEIMCGEARKNFIDMFSDILEEHICNDCVYRKECNFCPALFLQENGSFQEPSDYLCQITKQKHLILKKRGII